MCIFEESVAGISSGNWCVFHLFVGFVGFLMHGMVLQQSLHLGGHGHDGAACSEAGEVGRSTPPAHTEGNVTGVTLGIPLRCPFHFAPRKSLMRPCVWGSAAATGLPPHRRPHEVHV